MDTSAFVGTYPTDEPITSGLSVTRAQSSKVPGTVYFCGARQRVMLSDVVGEEAFDRYRRLNWLGPVQKAHLEHCRRIGIPGRCGTRVVAFRARTCNLLPALRASMVIFR